ncbi:hypothetical protein ABU614_08615 [Lysobacter firmicutimachus]|uniref:YwqJ-like deaminase n=1 Tax=Lysobacter firmicutimachus TaxID=1792846 RepID=A0AAU8MXX9_9GAMM
MPPVETPLQQQMLGALEGVSKDAVKELVALRGSASFDAAAFPDYLTRLSGGTVSTLRMKQVLPDGTTKVIEQWNARNGNSFGRQIAIKKNGVEQLAHFGNGRQEARTIVGPERRRYSDAEVKSLDRAVNVCQAKGLRSSEVILEGVIDRPPCANCPLNLKDAELLTTTAGYDAPIRSRRTRQLGIEIFHFDDGAQAQFASARRAAVGSGLETAGCK